MASEDNVAALLNLFEKFPNFKNSSVWMAGEGYGGVTAPYVISELDGYRDKNTGAWTPNVKGVMVGNPITNYEFDGLPALIKAAFSRGLIDDTLYESIQANCNYSYFNIFGRINYTTQCNQLLDKFLFYTNFSNPYDMYTRCYANQTIKCMWSNVVSEYFNSEVV
jgi:serine carboxypeptidase-like clade II